MDENITYAYDDYSHRRFQEERVETSLASHVGQKYTPFREKDGIKRFRLWSSDTA